MIRTRLFLLVAACCASQFEANANDTATFRQPDAEAFPDLFSWTSTCNSYVLRDGDAALVVDLGDGSLVGHLSKVGIKHIDWVLFTDHHREGCQGIEQVDRTKTKVAASKTEQEIFEKPTSYRKWFPKLGDKYSVYGASYARPHRHPLKLDKSFVDGDVFKWRSWEIRCLDTPGHSPGGMSYVVRRNSKTIALTGGIIHDGAKLTNWFDSEWDYGFAKGLDALIDSVDQLIQKKPNLVLPRQGPVIKNPAAQLPSYHAKLKAFRPHYLRGYQVFNAPPEDRDSISKATPVPLINQVTPHLYKLSPKNNPGKNFAIIVSDKGKGLVLDCGLFPKDTLEQIIVGMRRHMGLKSIDAFWISHMHGDHFLLGPTLKEKFGAKAWTLDRIADKCEHPRRYDYAALVSAYGDGFDGMKIDKRFRDGESIKWEGYRIQVDWMPGQTEFGCCLWLDIDGKRIAFTGDNLFGNPAKKTENGHEAVVARNSAIFEEGYLYGSRYLKDLKPDIVMGSHSNVMPNPAAFLDRYHKWSRKIIALYQDLLPDEDYEYLFDPYWVSAYPYRVDFTDKREQEIMVTIRNFRNAPQRHRVELKLPKGVTAEPAVLDGLVERESRHSYRVKLTVDPNVAPKGMQIVPFDIHLDGKHYGQLFDFLIRTPK